MATLCYISSLFGKNKAKKKASFKDLFPLPTWYFHWTDEFGIVIATLINAAYIQNHDLLWKPWFLYI